MHRIVLVIDSETGKLVNMAGVPSEQGRYRKFVKRILSTDLNPHLDYGGNGGRSLSIDCNGDNGDRITLAADDVRVTGDLHIGDKSVMEEIDGIAEELGELYVSKAALAEAVDGIEITEEDTLETLKEKMGTLISNLSDISGGGGEQSS